MVDSAKAKLDEILLMKSELVMDNHKVASKIGLLFSTEINICWFFLLDGV